jgi:hypothetical protein
MRMPMIDLASRPQNKAVKNTSSRLGCLCSPAAAVTQSTLQVMPDDNSELVPPLPIPNRTVKRLCADDSAATSVKVGHRQATIRKTPGLPVGGFLFSDQVTRGQPHSSQIQNATARMRPTRKHPVNTV